MAKRRSTSKSTPETEDAPMWGIVEVMGHNTFAGRISQTSLAGAAFVRVDVPAIPAHDHGDRFSSRGAVAAFTKYIGPSSIYAITLTTERAAREAASRVRCEPTHLVDIAVPRAIEAGSGIDED
jgi:hypothetical protein